MIGALIFIAFILFLVSRKGNSNIANDIRKAMYWVFGFISVILIISIISPVLTNSLNDETTVADGFTIEGYEVVLDVGIDNTIDVTETIDINFYESGHHGIYKFTPRWLEYTNKDKKTIKRKSNVLAYRAEGEQYTLDVVNDKDRIKIGNPYATVEGNHKYVIKYTYDMGKDPFSGYDEFIFHAFGDYWGTEIKNPKVIVHMPKDISGATVNVFRDKYRADNMNSYVTKEEDGNTIIITNNSDVPIFKSLTIDIELPEGYFVGGSWNYGWTSVIITIIVILLTIYVIWLWFKHGKDYEKRVPTVEFYAPDDLSSAEVGYVYNNRHVSKKLTISLIIELASKGYLKIDEIKDGRKSKIQITKTNIPPVKPSIDKEAIPRRTIEIQKLKDADDLLSDNAANALNHRFKHGDIDQISESTAEIFERYQDELVNGGYIKILSDNEKAVNLAYEKSGYDKKIAVYDKELAAYNEKLNKLPKKTALENIVYGNLFSTGDVIILSEHTSFYKTFGQIEKELETSFQNKVHEDKSRKCKRTAFFIAVVTLLLSLLSFFRVEDMDPSWSILYCISFGCVIVNIFFAFIMGRKTEYGENISARIKGFREFLVTAEKEKLEALVEKNPNYFYDILPYTYVLNISKKWIKKFENIKMPEADMGSFNYSSDVSFHSIFDNVSYPVSTSSSSGSGCSSCGGGCSSCGGGCSSCGGGGSW